MITYWDNDDHCNVEKCCCCGHVYRDYYVPDKTDTSEPFIEMKEVVVYERQYAYSGSRAVTLKQYACPKCGALQIDVRSL